MMLPQIQQRKTDGHGDFVKIVKVKGGKGGKGGTKVTIDRNVYEVSKWVEDVEK